MYSYRMTIEDETTQEVMAGDAFPFEKLLVGDGLIVENWEERALTDWDWRQIGDEIVTGFGVIPAEYALDQNYPNPFNPTTTIGFALPNAERTLLQIYNLRGQLVSTVVDGYRTAGFHEVTFDASGMASGMYIYRIQAGDFVANGKMMLIK
jgi:hypothetical protein